MVSNHHKINCKAAFYCDNCADREWRQTFGDKPFKALLELKKIMHVYTQPLIGRNKNIKLEYTKEEGLTWEEKNTAHNA